MKHSLKITALLTFVLAFMASSCSKGQQISVTPHNEVNSIYYWKTTLELDSAERKFIRDYNIQRAYIRFFDVTADKSPLATEEVIPNATIVIRDSMPVDEIVPTVFITTEAIERMKKDPRHWASKILERIRNMCSYYNFENVKEIQLDCDWTKGTKQTYFDLCRYVKSEMLATDSTSIVSSTIRLHQLKSAAPPVDYGVLMLYNTGSFKNPDAENSILTVDDVKAYIHNKESYPLHLDFAYPVYAWNLVYRNNRFLGILRDDSIVKTDLVKQIDDNRFQILRDTIIGERILTSGDIIRCEDVKAETVSEVKDVVEKAFGGQPHSSIIYHLDSDNLSKYKEHEIERLFD